MIEIVEYRSDWVGEHEALAERLRALAGGALLRVDPIGSTSVPGLAGKDVLDVQIGVARLGQTGWLIEALVERGFRFLSEVDRDHLPAGADPRDAAQWAKRYLNGPEVGRPIHVHVREVGRANWRYALLFRDYLRADAVARESYATLKRRLAAIAPDRDTYADTKDPVCDLILGAAEVWAARTGWHPGRLG